MAEIERFRMQKPKNATTYVSPSLAGKDRPFRKEFDPFRKLRSSERWQRLRALVLTDEPLCRCCGKIATEAHHIVEASKDADKFFERDNLVSVCEECHKKVHAAYRRGIAPEMLFKDNKKC